MESEVVFGTLDRLREVVSGISDGGEGIAVLNTCVPALTGEDLRSAIGDSGTIFVDAPGFCGKAEEGIRRAYAALSPAVEPSRAGINIDGLSLLDLFCRGNLNETERLFRLLGIPVAVRFGMDTYSSLREGAAVHSVSVNPSMNSGIGTSVGTLLFSDIPETVGRIAYAFPDADTDAVLRDWERADEQMFYSCDKYLRKFAPPITAIAAQASYAAAAKQMMERYFGSDVPVVLSRNPAPGMVCSVDYPEIIQRIRSVSPDLLLGSSFEARGFPNTAFFGITAPERSRISLAARPFAGIEGGLTLIEGSLNALMSMQARDGRRAL